MIHSGFKILLSYVFIQWTQSAKILNISPICSRSHHSLHSIMVKSLIDRGHEVTFISHFTNQLNSPNYKEIIFNETTTTFVDSVAVKDTPKLHEFWRYLFIKQHTEHSLCHKVFNLDLIKELVHSKRIKIDLLLVEVWETSCYHLLAHALNVPIILLVAPNLRPAADYYIGNPHNPSYIPILGTEFTTRMSFLERLKNTVLFTTSHWYRMYPYVNDNGNMAKKYFNVELPSREVLHSRTALALYNTHQSFLSRAAVPNMVNIGGIHIKPAKKLPKDLDEFISKSTHGVILFSFGTTIKASSVPAEKIKLFTEVFSMIPQRILWRVDDLNAFKVPSNVKLTKWLPQRDVLEHPNVIAFISHCGIFGTLEAIHTATPVVAIPFWIDQFQNAKLLIEKGVAKYVDYHNMDHNLLLSAINDVLTQRYQDNIQKYSKIFKDRPMPPTDEAMYWIEYVIKHRGAPHLRSPAADMSFYEYLLLDVIIFFFAILLFALYLCRRCLKLVKCSSWYGKQPNSKNYKCS